MADKGFRYHPDLVAALAPWRTQLGPEFDAVVAHLTDRDHHLEDYLNRPRAGTVVTTVSYQAAAGVGSYGGGAWADYPGPHDVSITKKYDAATSKLVVFGSASVYQSGVNGAVSIGLKFGSTDHTIGSFTVNPTFTHTAVTCQDDTFSGLGVGAHTGRVRWDSSTANVNTDTADAVRLTVMEVML